MHVINQMNCAFLSKSYKEEYCQVVRMGLIWFYGVIPSTSCLSALFTLSFGSFFYPILLSLFSPVF